MWDLAIQVGLGGTFSFSQKKKTKKEEKFRLYIFTKNIRVSDNRVAGGAFRIAERRHIFHFFFLEKNSLQNKKKKKIFWWPSPSLTRGVRQEKNSF